MQQHMYMYTDELWRHALQKSAQYDKSQEYIAKRYREFAEV